LDTANLFAMNDSPTLAIRRLSHTVDYIHLSDNRGHKVEHLVPGAGAIDWVTFFETLRASRFSGHVGIDVGGAESEVGNIDEAYRRSGEWLVGQLNRNE
jgi:sugar phosphate isomerase/epimerase